MVQWLAPLPSSKKVLGLLGPFCVEFELMTLNCPYMCEDELVCLNELVNRLNPTCTQCQLG